MTMKRVCITVDEEVWQWFKQRHISLSSFVQEKMWEIIPIAEKNSGC